MSNEKEATLEELKRLLAKGNEQEERLVGKFETLLDELIGGAEVSVLQLNMQREPSRAPTNEEIAANSRVEFGDREFVAAWYPQMGGYVGRCWIELHSCGDPEEPNDDGFSVLVYHDGEFPFDDTREPARLHHCSAEQFIEFGQLVQKLNAEDSEREP